MTTRNGSSASYQVVHHVPNEEETLKTASVEIESVHHGFDTQGATQVNDEDNATILHEARAADILSIDNAIERLGMGRFQRRILVAAGLCFAADSMEILLLSFLSVVLRAEWNLTEDETASITSSVFAGALLGTLTLGPLGDKVGRRPIFCLAASIISLFGMATALASNFRQLLAMRFIVGFGVGGLTVPFDTLAEFLPTSSRGKNLLYIEYFWTAGTLSVPLIAYWTLDILKSWQWFVFLCAIPCLISAILGTYFVPESPRWLCATGRSNKALAILRRAAAENGHDAEWLFPEGTQLVAEEEEHSTICDLFAPRWRCLTLKLWGAWLGFAFGYFGTILAITQVFDNEKETDARALSDTGYEFDYAAIFKSGAGEVLGTTMVILTIDRVGRVPSQVASYAMGGVCVFLLCILAEAGAPRATLVILAFLARTFEMSGTCTTWVSTAEVLTTEIRTSGHSAANAIARIGGFFSPFLVEESTPLITIGVVMLCTHAFTVLCTSQLPETKGLAMGVTPESGTTTNVGPPVENGDCQTRQESKDMTLV